MAWLNETRSHLMGLDSRQPVILVWTFRKNRKQTAQTGINAALIIILMKWIASRFEGWSVGSLGVQRQYSEDLGHNHRTVPDDIPRTFGDSWQRIVLARFDDLCILGDIIMSYGSVMFIPAIQFRLFVQRVWNVATGDCLFSVPFRYWIKNISFDVDGTGLILSLEDKKGWRISYLPLHSFMDLTRIANVSSRQFYKSNNSPLPIVFVREYDQEPFTSPEISSRYYFHDHRANSL